MSGKGNDHSGVPGPQGTSQVVSGRDIPYPHCTNPVLLLPCAPLASELVTQV